MISNSKATVNRISNSKILIAGSLKDTMNQRHEIRAEKNI